MNTTEHLLTCLGEEGCEISKDVSKSLRFGLDDRNLLDPDGPPNRERLLADLLVDLQHGTEEEHRATLERAKAAGLSYIWSGDIRRNAYPRENLRFGGESGILSTKWVESDQESGWEISWANSSGDSRSGDGPTKGN